LSEEHCKESNEEVVLPLHHVRLITLTFDCSPGCFYTLRCWTVAHFQQNSPCLFRWTFPLLLSKYASAPPLLQSSAPSTSSRAWTRSARGSYRMSCTRSPFSGEMALWKS